MDILTEEYLTIKNQIEELKGENKVETSPLRIIANKKRIGELEVAAQWALTQISMGDERSYIS